MHNSFSTFVITPIQTSTPTDIGYISPLTLHKKDEEWLYETEIDSKRMSDEMMAEVLSGLQKKLEAIKPLV